MVRLKKKILQFAPAGKGRKTEEKRRSIVTRVQASQNPTQQAFCHI
jgi:hypothetical protein